MTENPLHIGFLTPEYPHALVGKSGGLGTSLYTLAKELVACGQQVTVFLYGQKQSWIRQLDGVEVHSIAQKKYTIGGWYFYRKFLNSYLDQVIAQKRIQVLEVPDYTGVSAFMQFKIPVVMRLHGNDTYFCALENRQQKWKNRWFEANAFKSANYYIAPTQFAGEFTSKVFNRPSAQITILPHGIDLSQFVNPHPAQFESNSLLYIGTLIRKKGVLELPAIFNRVVEANPEATLNLIGGDSKDILTQSPSTWALMKAEFSEKALERVTYHGPKPFAEVQHYIAQTQLVVLPTFAETLGLVTIEAMAMQKTVLSSDKGWVSELMKHGESGFQINPQNHLEFADQIINLLQQPEQCIAIGQRAREFVAQRFDLKQIVKENITNYKKMIDGQRVE